MLSFAYLWGSLAFIAPRGAEEINSTTMRLLEQLKPFPLDGVGGRALGRLLLSVVPAGFLAWLPSRVLLGLDDSTRARAVDAARRARVRVARDAGVPARTRTATDAPAPPATWPMDIAVSLDRVWKVYRQRQRSARVGDVFRNLLRPQIVRDRGAARREPRGESAARSSRTRGRTARARARPSSCSRACSRPTRARCACSAWIRCASACATSAGSASCSASARSSGGIIRWPRASTGSAWSGTSRASATSACSAWCASCSGSTSS